jgi:hypothetical protein
VEITFAILGFFFLVMGCTAVVVCIVKINKMQQVLKESGIAQ